jgi:hypothetical protein
MNPVEYILPLCTFAGTLTVIAIGFIHNNSRMSDLRNDLGNRIDLLKELMDAKLARQEEMLLSKFAELDNRLTRIESHLHLQ